MKNKLSQAFQAGQKVVLSIDLDGAQSNNEHKVTRVDSKGVWLDGGAGSKEIGPFDKQTGTKKGSRYGVQVIAPK